MLQNAYFLAKIGADTAENEQHFAENLPKIGNYPTGPVSQNRAMAGLVPLKRGAVRVPAAGVVYMCPTPCIAKFGLSLS